jgi:WD40 repeat protein
MSSSSSRLSLSSEEVNILIYRYLLDSGFSHSAYLFNAESGLHKASLGQIELPPSALITYLQKGLIYLYLETHVNSEGLQVEGCTETFSLLRPHEHKFDDEPVKKDLNYNRIVQEETKKLKRGNPGGRGSHLRKNHSQVPQEKTESDSERDETGQNGNAEKMDVEEESVESRQPDAVSTGAYQLIPVEVSEFPETLVTDSAPAGVDFRKSDNCMAFVTVSGQVGVFDPVSGKVRNLDPVLPANPIPQAEAEAVVRWSEDGKYLMANHSKRAVCVWKFHDDGHITSEIPKNFLTGVHASWCKSSSDKFALLITKSALAVFSNSNSGKPWDLAMYDLRTVNLTVLDIVWLSEKQFAVSCTQGQVLIYAMDASTVHSIHKFRVSQDLAYKMCYNEDLNELAIANGNIVSVFDLNTGINTKTLTGHRELVAEVLWTEDNLLISGGDDNEVLLWQGDFKVGALNQNSVVNCILGHNKYLVCGLESGQVKIWDISIQAQIGLIQLQRPINEIAFKLKSPTEMVLAITSQGSPLKIVSFQIP